MIVECQTCNSKFSLDESLVKKTGSKSRCSMCKSVFMIYPPQGAPVDEPSPDKAPASDLDKTINLGISSPASGEVESDMVDEGAASAVIEEVFEKAIEEMESPEALSPNQIPEGLEEETVDMEEALAKAARIEEAPIPEELERDSLKEPERTVKAAAAVPLKDKSRRSNRLPIIVLIVILLLIGGSAFAIRSFAPDLIPDFLSFLRPAEEQKTPDVGVRRLSFKAVTGSFVQSGRQGQLFVIKGMVTNNYPGRRSFILVKGTILDDKGQAVKTKVVFAGNTFTERQIKDMTMEEIENGLKNRFGKGRINYNIEPAGTVPFMIIFQKLPENMSEFTVEAVSSSPGESK
jgi:predicted Zn finger-like uncharacterized protein